MLVEPHPQWPHMSRASTCFMETAMAFARTYRKPSHFVRERFQSSELLMHTPVAPHELQVTL